MAWKGLKNRHNIVFKKVTGEEGAVTEDMTIGCQISCTLHGNKKKLTEYLRSTKLKQF